MDAVRSRKDELIVTAGLAVAVVLFGATALYWAEGAVQPNKFGSVPRSIWWAVVTLTTIRYGDAYPVNSLGKVLAALVIQKSNTDWVARQVKPSKQHVHKSPVRQVRRRS